MDIKLLQAQVGLWNLTFGYLKTMSLKCALDLGIPDAIYNNGQPMSLSQLHSVLSLPPSKKSHLYRLMRLLTHIGFFIEKSANAGVCSEAVYDLTAQSRIVIQNNESANMLPFVLCSLHDKWLRSSLFMGDWFMKDSKQNPFELANGSTVWEIASQEPVVNQMFNDAMVSSSCMFNDYIVKYGDEIFKGIESLVDVGGGKGAMAEVIAKNFPHVRCSVLDLPHVVCDNPDDGIVKFVPGDMFNYVPPADAVLLKWVLHDWSNEDCIRILQRCKDAISSRKAGGKVIVMEAVVGLTSAVISEEPQLLLDMLMLTVTEGEERDENVWKYLFTEAGFSSYKITFTIGFLSIIEVYP
ncbi:O-methyltransferase [Rhynchospora pubera]|uniref:O-methyltransferase n=1 Tax=Rhynchospora pubera TaxID=906938 RepID=A0AAV8HNY6_9POAL|nr:O-methyltransferase [Rhynchospora pubera]